MLKAERSKSYIKVEVLKNLKFLQSKLLKIKGTFFSIEDKKYMVPLYKMDEFKAIMGDHLIIWEGENIDTGGIQESSLPAQPIVDGYSVTYDKDRNIINSTGFKVPPWGEFQVKGFNCILNRPFLILADDAGLGKTWQVVTAMEARKKLGLVNKGLVIPKASLLYNWRDEIHRHTNCKAEILIGSPKQRAKTFNHLYQNDDWTFLILSYEMFRLEYGNLQMLDDYQSIDFTILDEAHKIKNPLSKLGRVIHYVPVKYKYVLTATPIPNNPLEAYNYLKYGGKIKQSQNQYDNEYSDWYRFRNRYAVMGGYNKKEIVGYKNVIELQKLIQDNMLRRLKSEKLKELPEEVFKTIKIDMNPKQNKLYTAVKKEIMEDLQETSLEKIPNTLSKLIRLQQITDSPALIESDVKSSKVKTLDEMLEDLIDEGGQKVIIFSRFKSFIDILSERYSEYKPAIIHGMIDAEGKTREQAERLTSDPKQVDKLMTSDRQKEVYKFQQDSKCRLFLGSSSACREGLTLTAATHVIFTDVEWAWDYVNQAYSRAHRIGQKNAVTIHFLVCKDTIDEKILNTVMLKKNIGQAILGIKRQDTLRSTQARDFIESLL